MTYSAAEDGIPGYAMGTTCKYVSVGFVQINKYLNTNM